MEVSDPLVCSCPGERQPDDEEHVESCPHHVIDVVLPDTDPHGEPGWRLHFVREPLSNATLAEEQVLPEKVADPWANRIIARKEIRLRTHEIDWLRDRLDDVGARLKQEYVALAVRDRKMPIPGEHSVRFAVHVGWNADDQRHEFVVTCEHCGIDYLVLDGKNINVPAGALKNWMINHRHEHTRTA